jgi:hypothetical protein
MKKTDKLTLIFAVTLSAISFSMISCNNDGAKDEAKQDSATAEVQHPADSAQPTAPTAAPEPPKPVGAAQSPQETANQIAENAVQQYEQAKRAGDKVDIAIRANIVAEAYKQAKDEANYQKWKEIVRKAKKDAGMPE